MARSVAAAVIPMRTAGRLIAKPPAGYGATVAQVAVAVTVQVSPVTAPATTSAWISHMPELNGRLDVANTLPESPALVVPMT
jgi:hypothetical protein